MEVYPNPAAGVVAGRTAPLVPGVPRTFHRSIAGYRPSPLVDSPSAAAATGLAQVLVKHEADRFGLPAFKILGASWATACLVGRRLGIDPAAVGFDGLRDAAAGLGALTLVTATDGNHGRAVARAAAWLGLDAHVLVPAGTVAARIEAIAGEGARVTVVDGDYDEAVRHAATLADDAHVVVSDTSWPGYEDTPCDIAAGYSTIFEELDEQLAALGLDGPPDAVVVPVGVGALAMAAVGHWPLGAPAGPVRIAVEPADADCLLRSLEAGEPVTVEGPHTSIMAGMNCGTVSMVAWPAMRSGIDWCVAVDDDHARAAMRLLADDAVVAGETGAASLAALLAVADTAHGLARVGLGSDSVVVCLCTEGATDPVNYRAVVGLDPEDVR